MAEKRSEASREQRKAYMKRKREICIAFSVCRECMASDALPGTKKCKECTEKGLNRNKKDREWYKDNGICTKCRRHLVMEGKTICINCSLADSLSFSRRKYTRKRVAIKKPKLWMMQGLCYQCGAPVMPGRKQCEKHYLISKAQADKINEDTSNHIWRRLSDADVARQRNKTK